MLSNKLAKLNSVDWHDTVSHGDVVQFRFPIEGEGDQKQPAPCPCLVLDVEIFAGMVYAVLAPGMTSQGKSRSDRGFQISADDLEVPATAALNHPIRFETEQRICVPLSHEGFAPDRASDSPVTGRLTGSAFERMNAIRARIHAERDIAREARTEQRRNRRKGQRKQPRTVIVERRRPKRPIRPVIGDAA